MDEKENKVTAERLTGKQRCWRGLKYFLWVFAAIFVLVTAFWWCTAGINRLFWETNCMFWGIYSLPAAVLTGLAVLALGRRRRWHRFAAGGVAIAAFVVWLRTIWPAFECYCPWNPAIDTRFAPGFSEEAFSAVRPGMAEAEVVALLGEPFYKQDVHDGDGNAYDLWYYTADGKCEHGDYAWLGREIAIRDGVVLYAGRLVHYD